jgi:hypothetical protein
LRLVRADRSQRIVEAAARQEFIDPAPGMPIDSGTIQAPERRMQQAGLEFPMIRSTAREAQQARQDSEQSGDPPGMAPQEGLHPLPQRVPPCNRTIEVEKNQFWQDRLPGTAPATILPELLR